MKVMPIDDDNADAAPVERPVRRRGRPANDGAHAVRENAVLDAAFHSFAERGYEATTLRELAKDLGVSHNLLNVRFGSKADLWRRAIDARVAQVAPPVFAAFDAPGLTSEARLRELVLRFCGWAAQNPDFVALSQSEGRRATWRLDYLVDAYILPFKHRLDTLLGEVAAERPVRDISTTAFMALLVQGVGFYFSSAPLLARIGSADEAADGHTERQVRIFAGFILAGLLAADV